MNSTGRSVEPALELETRLLPERIRTIFRHLDAQNGTEFLARFDSLAPGRVPDSERVASLLMEAFARTRDLDAFQLLYEATERQIQWTIARRIRYAGSTVDPKDVLQDVFVSIYRYPHCFRNEKSASFRNWSFSIVRNTLLKHLRTTPRAEIDLEPLAEFVEDERVQGPLATLAADEEARRANETFALCLVIYRRAFQTGLNDREKRALRAIEVQGLKYRDAAERMGVKLENLKMIVCRARKKLLRVMEELLESTQP